MVVWDFFHQQYDLTKHQLELLRSCFEDSSTLIPTFLDQQIFTESNVGVKKSVHSVPLLFKCVDVLIGMFLLVGG